MALDELLNEQEVARVLGMSVRTLQAMRVRGSQSLPFCKLGARSVRYRRADVNRFIEESLVNSTTEADAKAAFK